MDIIGSYRSKYRIRCLLRSQQTTHSHTQPMRHTKSWHNLIRDLFNYKITAIEHFFFARLVHVFVRVACMYAFVLFTSLLPFETFSLCTSVCTATAIGSPFVLLILFLCLFIHWKHSWILSVWFVSPVVDFIQKQSFLITSSLPHQFKKISRNLWFPQAKKVSY